jgi:hypothetical protein
LSMIKVLKTSNSWLRFWAGFTALDTMSGLLSNLSPGLSIPYAAEDPLTKA